MKRQHRIILAVAVAVALVGLPLVACEREEAVLVGEPRAMTHFTGLEISGSETDALVVNQASTGDIAEFRDNGTAIFRIADGGAVTHVSGNFTMSSGNLALTSGNLTLTSGNLVQSDGDTTVADDLRIAAQTAFSLVADLPITPTGTYLPLTSAAAVTCSTTLCVVSGTVAGELLILENQNASDAIIIDGTGANVECGSSDITLGATDNLTLLWNGTDWLCISNRDN